MLVSPAKFLIEILSWFLTKFFHGFLPGFISECPVNFHQAKILEIASGIPCRIASEIPPDISSMISLGIVSWISSGIFQGIPFGILPEIRLEIFNWIPSKIPSFSGKLLGILPRIISLTLLEILCEIFPGISLGIFYGIPAGISSGLPTGIPPNRSVFFISSGISLLIFLGFL